MALWLKGPERGRRVDAHTTKCTVYIGASSLDIAPHKCFLITYLLIAQFVE
jgi:hypothetical protein